MKEIIVILVICILVALLLRVIKNRYISEKELNKNQINKIETNQPSYKKYKKISKKASPPNSPKRTAGDFYDYIRENITTESSAIENKILKLYGEDFNE